MSHNVYSSNLFAGKVVYIAGGTSGINLGIAMRFADLGARIAVVGRDADKAANAAKEIRERGVDAIGLSADVREFDAVEQSLKQTAEKFGERILLAPQQVHGVDFSKQIKLLDQAADCVVQMVQSLRNGVNLDEIKALNDKLQHVEGDADKAMMELYQDLFSGRHDALKVIVLKDLYELLEKVIDRCRDAGNVISQIVLKNS